MLPSSFRVQRQNLGFRGSFGRVPELGGGSPRPPDYLCECGSLHYLLFDLQCQLSAFLMTLLRAASVVGHLSV